MTRVVRMMSVVRMVSVARTIRAIRPSLVARHMIGHRRPPGTEILGPRAPPCPAVVPRYLGVSIRA